MKHSILRKLMLIAVLLTSSHAFAHDFEVDGIYYNILSETDKTCEVTYQGTYPLEYSNEYTGEIVIPESVTSGGATYSVTSIGSDAFSSCTGLASVTIGNSVTSIGSDAFERCSGLTSITIPNSVTSIGESAFERCSGLTSITIPNSVTSIGKFAFAFSSGLTSVTIPNSVTSIGMLVFRNCSGLTSIVVESGNTVYDSRDNCNAIIETATKTLIEGCKNTIIPNSVTSIGVSAFVDCSGLTSITIPNSVTSIGNYAFSGSGLASVTIGNSVTSIGEGAFSYCTGLTNVTIENGVTSIGKETFSYCTGLTNITIPYSVTSIGNNAFYQCSGLTSVIIGNGVTSIGEGAFYQCSGITEIICENMTPPTAFGNTFLSISTTATIYVPVGSKDAYASANGWSYFSNIKEIKMQTEPIVTIMDASNQGSVSFSYEEGKAFDFTVTPVTGYIVNTVLVNGEEISSDNGDYKIGSVNEETIISVSYEIDPATGVNTLNANNLKVYGYNETLTVTGTEFGDTISIYDLNGAMLKTQNSVGSTNYISLDNGIYIVKVNGKSYKVIL